MYELFIQEYRQKNHKFSDSHTYSLKEASSARHETRSSARGMASPLAILSHGCLSVIHVGTLGP